jgi:hypothetical protein
MEDRYVQRVAGVCPDDWWGGGYVQIIGGGGYVQMIGGGGEVCPDELQQGMRVKFGSDGLYEVKKEQVQMGCEWKRRDRFRCA